MLKKRWLLFIFILVHASPMSCDLLLKPAFSKQIDKAYKEFQQKDRVLRCYRYLCYGLIGTGFGLAVFRNAFPSPSRIQEKMMYDQVQQLVRERKMPPQAASTSGFFKHMIYSATGLLSGFVASFIRDGLLNNLAYGLIGPLLEPIQRTMNSQRTVLTGDVWFLREQVRESRAPFVLVSIDLSNFIDELKAWELEIRYSLLALTTDSAATIIPTAQQRICHRMARIIGHIRYICDKASPGERLTMKVLHDALHNSIESAINEWLTSSDTHDIAAITHATTLFEKTIKCALLPLLSVSLYRIHPWPASVACSDFARLCVTSVVAGYGNPILQ